jgi:hypothetical protein
MQTSANHLTLDQLDTVHGGQTSPRATEGDTIPIPASMDWPTASKWLGACAQGAYDAGLKSGYTGNLPTDAQATQQANSGCTDGIAAMLAAQK